MYALVYQLGNKEVTKRFITVSEGRKFIENFFGDKRTTINDLIKMANGENIKKNFKFLNIEHNYKNKDNLRIIKKIKTKNHKKKKVNKYKKVKPHKTWFNKFFPNQIHTAENLTRALSKYNKIVFRAAMQSGKTGTLEYLLNYKISGMFSKHRYAIYITGLSDKNFKEQNFRILTAPVLLENDTEQHSCINYVNIQKRDIEGHINEIKKHDVVIIDESDWGSGDESIISKLMQSGVLDNKIVILVSATNHEMTFVDMIQKYEWHMVEVDMKVLRDNNYKGIDFFRENEYLKDNQSVFPLVRDGKNYDYNKEFKENFDWWMNSSGKYAIIRIGNGHSNAEKFISMVQKDYGDAINLIPCYGFNIKEEMEIIKSNALNIHKKNVIVVVQTLRAGHDLGQIIKEEITFVWDTLKSSSASVQQSLAGRLCGFGNYKKEKRIFVNFSVLDSKILDVPTNSRIKGKGRKIQRKDPMPASVNKYYNPDYVDFIKYVSQKTNIEKGCFYSKIDFATQNEIQHYGKKTSKAHRVGYQFMKLDKTIEGVLAKARYIQESEKKEVANLRKFYDRNKDGGIYSLCIIVCDFVDSKFFSQEEKIKIQKQYPEFDCLRKKMYYYFIPDNSLKGELLTDLIPQLNTAYLRTEDDEDLSA